MTKVYYNEFDPFAAAWLQELMNAGEISPGDIDTRSILEIKADDIKDRYTQYHFFAGIGGWPLALKFANWEPTRPVWTGSCPCQPFSTAGKQKGKKDGRHLWPVWFNLIRELRPSSVFGEQVAASITHGWLDSVYDDLEAEGYAVGSAILPACSVGAAHRRERLWFVAHCSEQWGNERRISEHSTEKNLQGKVRGSSSSLGYSEYNGHFTPSFPRSERQTILHNEERPHSTCSLRLAGAVPDVAESFQSRPEGLAGHDSISQGWKKPLGCDSPFDPQTFEWIECPDGKIRPVKSDICLLADGIPNRVGKLRGYGNAIVPQIAAQFIKASM